MFYGAGVWDPWLIVAQIVCLQCLYYLTLGVFMAILVGTRVSRISLVYFFDFSTLTGATVTGWCVIASFGLSALAGAVFLLYLIERAKKCLDFSATLYVIHLFICIIYGGWPSSITWWVVNGTCLAMMALLGEYLCIRRELLEIPITRYRSIMSQNVDISRANWTDPIQRKHFIDLCLQEANKGFRSGGGLKSSAWSRIAEELEKLLGKRYTSKQLKNGWDYMKRQYLIWSKMMTMTGHGYNSVTKTLDWPAEKWEEYLQKYPEAKQFRFKPLANVEELEALFGGVLATGSKNWSSGGVIASGAEESSTHSTSMPSETSISSEEDEDLPRNTNDEAEGSKKKQKKGKKEQTQEEMNRIVNVLENFEGPSVKECMKILKRLLTYEDPLYYVAINAFCKKKEYREVWMEMESDEERMGWIQSLRK